MTGRPEGTNSAGGEYRSHRTWKGGSAPENILAIRFHAIGDVAITFPTLQAVRQRYPATTIDLLTTQATAGLAEATGIFRSVSTIGIPRNRTQRLTAAVSGGFRARSGRYDIVLDLQRNWISRTVRSIVSPAGWAEFDRFSPTSAHIRTLRTVRAAGLDIPESVPPLSLPRERFGAARDRLLAGGWDGTAPLVCLNPAGLWTSRQWPAASYATLATLLTDARTVQFILLGTERMSSRSAPLARSLGERVIDLVGSTSLAEAFGIVQHASLIVSEDSGLMHLAWVSGVPTVALFGSSRHDWSAPVGKHTALFHSGDLECGACMDPDCRFGDTHCLTRVSPDQVLEQSLRLLDEYHGART